MLDLAMSELLETQPGKSTDAGQPSGGRVRPQLTITVHPDTIERLALLASQFKQSRGQIIDRLVLVLAAQYREGRVYCLTGEPCRFNRQDVPGIF